MSMHSAIYAGDVVHARLRPRAHNLHYRVFSLLVDLDELPTLSKTLRLFGHNRAALYSFHDMDHGDGTVGGLRPWVEQRLHDAGLALPDPEIRVLCYPRIFGYVFNPLTVYFCHARGGALHAILYEVSNTFGEKRTYVIPVTGDAGRTVRQSCGKEHYVSPFLPMALRYEFLIKPPQDRVLIRVDDHDADGLLLRAAFSGRHRALTDSNLFKMLFAYPLMTLKVTAAIHWEAFHLWRKGIPVFGHHAAPKRSVTSVIAPNAGPSRV